MDMNGVQTIISTVGFPIFVAVWMLYKSSKDSEKMSETISELRNAITELSAILTKTEDKKDER